RRLQCTSRRLRVRERDHLRTFAFQKLRSFGFGKGFAPRLFAASHTGSMPAAHLEGALGKIAAYEHAELRSRLDKIRDGGFHPGAAGAGNRENKGILGSIDRAEIAADFLYNFKKEWVEMADNRLAHRFIDARLDLGRPRAI